MASLITGTDIFTKVSRILQDATNVRWTAPELLDWLNSAQRALVSIKPNINTSTVNINLIAGSKQALPSDMVDFGEITRNIYPNSTAGPAILPIPKVVLDNSYPGWHTATASSIASFYCYDPKLFDVFWVYPPQPTSTQQKVEAILTTLPTSLATAASTIGLDDIYEMPLIHYVLCLCFLKDSEYGALNYQRAMGHYQSVLELLSIKASAEKMQGPVMPTDGKQAPVVVQPSSSGGQA